MSKDVLVFVWYFDYDFWIVVFDVDVLSVRCFGCCWYGYYWWDLFICG